MAVEGTPEAIMSLLFGYLPAGLVLNVGSGATDGGAARADQHVVSCDLVADQVDHGSFFVGDVGALPVREGRADAVLAKDVIEHVDDVIPALRELRRVVRPAGVLLVTVPRAIPRAVWDDPTHRRGFTSRALQTALTGAGWAPGRCSKIGPIPGVGRLGFERHLTTLMRIPLLGHWFGTNWLCTARAV